jgi:hypothetical protein
MKKQSLHSLKALAISLILMVPIEVMAVTCLDVFPTVLSSSANNGKVTFEQEVRIKGTNGKIDISIDKDDTSGSALSCISQQCEDSGNRANTFTLPDFQKSSSNQDEKADNGESLNLPQSSYDKVEAEYQSSIRFTQNSQDTFIKELKAEERSTITFDGGVYWIEKLDLKYLANIVINGNDKVILMTKEKDLNNNEVSYNITGNPDQLVIVAYDDVKFGYKTSLKGFIYADKKIELDIDSDFEGAIHSEDDIKFKYKASINDARANLESANFNGLCAVSQTSGLSGNLNVDNEFEAYLSTDDTVQGVFLSSGDDWPTTYNLLSELEPGQDYYLHIKATDKGGVAGFLGDFEINGTEHTFSNGLTTLTTNTTDWMVSTSGWNNYQTPSSYGANGSSPWGTRTLVDANAQWIWSSDNDNDNLTYFSTRIGAPPLTPLLDYRFDECRLNGVSGDIVDQTGNFNGSSHGVPAPIDNAIINKSLDLSATDVSDWISVPNSALDGVDDFSIAVWFKTSVTKSQQEILHAIGSDTDDDELEIFLKDSDVVSVKVRDNSEELLSSISLTDGNWHHMVLTRAGQDVCLFIDGAQQQCKNGINSGALSVTNADAIVIGQEQDAFGGSFTDAQSFVGQLDEFKIFGKKIADIQIYNMHQNELVGNNYDASLRDIVQCNLALAGRVTLNNTVDSPAFTSVCFDTPFSEVPRVFSLPTTVSDSDRLALRIRNVTKTGFEIAQVESEEDNNPNAPAGNVSQTVDFFAIPEGDYPLNDGATMRVSSVNTQRNQGKRTSGSSWEVIDTTDLGFSQSPAIIASIQTMNNETSPFPSSNPFLATTIQNIGTGSFNIALERAETDDGVLTTDENIAYIAITPGIAGQLTSGISYESFQTANRSITGFNTCQVVNLNGDYSNDIPLVIASQNSRNGADGGWLKRCSISSSSVGFSIVEDMDGDTEGAHTTELAGGIALSGTFTNQTCTAQPSYVHHYEIIHDGQGLTCDTEVVTVNACENASCSTLSTQPITLNFLVNGSVISSPAFTGSTAVNVNNIDVETISFSLANTSITASNPVECDDSSGNSCDMAFTDAGFRFLSGAGNETTLPNQTAGSMFGATLKLQAVQNDNGVCTGFFNGDNDIDIDLSQENVEPGGTSGLSFTVDGATIAKHSSVTSTRLNFAAQSIATIPTPIYHDAGQIRLRASYNQPGAGVLSGSSNTFWVSPAELEVSATLAGSALNAASANATLTHEAGDDFDLNVTAINSLGVVTPNYSPGQIQLMLTRTGPTLTDSVDGNLRYESSGTLASSTSSVFQNVTLTAFSSGVSTFNAAQYSEVGLLNLDVQDNNYGNGSMLISATAINIGRFIPAYFAQTVADDGLFAATCNSITTFAAYSGQMDEATNSIGAISYLTNPVLAITAHNTQGNITQNYFDDYMKLSASDINLTVPNVDQSAVGADSNQLSLTAVMSNGILSQTNLTASSNGTALPKGTLHYQLSDADHFFYNRSANALVAPFTSDIDFSVATIVDADNVSVTTTVDVSPTGVEIRFGRLLLNNSFGPETSNFPQLMEIEHFDGNAFEATLDENCASYDAGKILLTDISLDPSHTSVLGGTGSFINGQTQTIELQAPGAGIQGQIGVRYNAYDWFNYDWDNDGAYNDSPEAVATFGIYRGNDRTIHWREVFND